MNRDYENWYNENEYTLANNFLDTEVKYGLLKLRGILLGTDSIEELHVKFRNWCLKAYEAYKNEVQNKGDK